MERIWGAKLLDKNLFDALQIYLSDKIVKTREEQMIQM